MHMPPYPEAATEGVLYKKVFPEILKNSLENTSARVSLFNKFLLT